MTKERTARKRSQKTESHEQRIAETPDQQEQSQQTESEQAPALTTRQDESEQQAAA